MKKRRTYGVSCVGSKGLFAEALVGAMPPALHFFDLFAGGGAVSHCASLSGKFVWVHMSDIVDTPQLFLDACNGVYRRNPPRAVSRSEFYENYRTDAYARLVWSHGSNGNDYQFGNILGMIQMPLARMVLGRSVEERYKALAEFVGAFHEIGEMGDNALLSESDAKTRAKILSLHRCEEIRPIDRILRLQELEGTNTQKMDFRMASYETVKIPTPSEASRVVYCDPPYRKGKVVNPDRKVFDYDRFYQWAEEIPNIYVSEYWMPDAFVDVWGMRKGQNYNGAGEKVTEKLWIPRRNLAEYREEMEKTRLKVDIKAKGGSRA